MDELIRQGTRELTVIANDTARPEVGDEAVSITGAVLPVAAH